MKAARAQAATNPLKAAALAEMARDFAPEQVGPPSFAADVLARLGLYDEAIVICKRAIDEHGHESLRTMLATLEGEAERRNLESALSHARAALLADDPEEALDGAREILGRRPRERVAAFRAALAAHDTGVLEFEQDRLEELDRYVLRFGDAFGAHDAAALERGKLGARANCVISFSGNPH